MAPEMKVVLPGTKINSSAQGCGTNGSTWDRDEGVHSRCDGSSWWVEAVLWCGLCRYFFLHDQRECPCPMRQQQCQTCAACTPLALHFIWKLLSSLALFQSSSITNVSACCLQILWWWVPNHTPVSPKEVTCTGQLAEWEPAQSALLPLTGQESGLMDCRERVQEENEEQCYVPSLAVHPQYRPTRGLTSFIAYVPSKKL